MATRASTRWAKLLGETAAYVQDGIDWAVDMGFKALKNIGDKKTQENGASQNKYVRGARQFGRALVHFLGVMGDEYYRTYERLKKRKSE